MGLNFRGWSIFTIDGVACNSANLNCISLPCSARQANDGDGVLVRLVLSLGGGVSQTEPGPRAAG